MQTKHQKIHGDTGIKQGFFGNKSGLSTGAYSLIVGGIPMPELSSAIRITRFMEK
ncbi:hypothetical protein [Bacillus sp. FSL K6-3431]|uniref:hypothetical protein n=1 Tax=Bacillus sp. FSL K6-3431 TaxID=2921500 RepID=UPI0030FAFCBD